LRSATKAAPVVLLWAVVVQPNLDEIGSQLHGVLLELYEVLPDASINTVPNLYDSTTTGVPGTLVSAPSGVQVAPGARLRHPELVPPGVPGYSRSPHPPPVRWHRRWQWGSGAG
jgi:hypothetical protein